MEWLILAVIFLALAGMLNLVFFLLQRYIAPENQGYNKTAYLRAAVRVSVDKSGPEKPLKRN